MLFTSNMSSEVQDEVTCHECSIQHVPSAYSEDTPLLRDRRSNANWFFILFLLMLLCCGVAIGVYLLIEDTERENDEPYPQAMETDVNTTKLSSVLPSSFEFPPRKVLLVEIVGPPCNSTATCIKQIQETTTENVTESHKPKVIYNFIINSDGQVFEDHGWDLHCTNCDNDTINIAMLVNFEGVVPTAPQINQVTNLLELGISKNKLLPCHLISAQSNFNATRADLVKLSDGLQQQMNLVHGCNTVLSLD